MRATGERTVVTDLPRMSGVGRKQEKQDQAGSGQEEAGHAPGAWVK